MFRNRNRKEQEPTIYVNKASTVALNLKNGIDPNFIKLSGNNQKMPALSHAIVENYSEVIQILEVLVADPRTDVNIKDTFENTCLMYTCRSYLSDDIGAHAVTILLQSNQIDSNAKNYLGWTATNLACWNGRVECLRELLKHDTIDVNIANNDGWTPLYSAVVVGNLDCVKLLLNSSSIDPNIISEGETPLHLAQRENKKLIIMAILKDQRSDPTIEDVRGNRVIDVIEDEEVLKCIQPIIHEDNFCI